MFFGEKIKKNGFNNYGICTYPDPYIHSYTELFYSFSNILIMGHIPSNQSKASSSLHIIKTFCSNVEKN